LVFQLVISRYAIPTFQVSCCDGMLMVGHSNGVMFVCGLGADEVLVGFELDANRVWTGHLIVVGICTCMFCVGGGFRARLEYSASFMAMHCKKFESVFNSH